MKTISTSNLIKKYTEKPIMEISDNENISSHKIILVSIDYKLNNKYLNSLYFEKNKELFNQFAHEQWNGIKVYTGQYLVLFDSVHGCSIYNVIFVDFEGITITNMTSFQLSNKENITSIDFDLMNYIAHSIDVDRKKLIQSKKITLKIIGYVNSSNYIDEEESNITDLMLFKEYIREQYKESELKKNQYIFDHNLFRGLACKITCIEPQNSNSIGLDTNILIIQENENIKKIDTTKKITQNSFEEIIGQEKAKKKCYIIEKYLLNPNQFGKWAPKNILFYGPSGTGKTMMAKALAHKINVPFFSIKATRLIGEFVGEGSKQIHELYDKAEEMAPCIIFIDEIDAIALDRKYQDLRGDVIEIVNALITEMDGLSERVGICTIGSTNRIDSLDISARSRFEEEIEFVLPTQREIEELISININTFPLPLDKNFDIKKLASYSNGLSGRDIVEKILKTSLHEAIIENQSCVSFKLFKQAVENIQKFSQINDINMLYT